MIKWQLKQCVDKRRNRRALGQIMSPPNTAIIIRIGASQYFFRTRINAQSSLIIDHIASTSSLLLKLVVHCSESFLLYRCSLYPIGFSRSRTLKLKQILSKHSQQYANRCDG